MKQTLQLEDLTCPTCVKKIEKAMHQTSGIHTANVRFNASKLDLDFDETIISIQAIENILEGIGFKVLV